jgi:hypothetical protein
MENDFRERSRKNYNTMKTVYNITMGSIIVGIGILMLFSEKFGLTLFDTFGREMVYALSALFILYGGFRLYRGIKKDY